MGLTLYALLAYLAVGYLVAAIAACLTRPVDGERVDVTTLQWVFGWGIYLAVFLWQVCCLPILFLRRARWRMAEPNNE